MAHIDNNYKNLFYKSISLDIIIDSVLYFLSYSVHEELRKSMYINMLKQSIFHSIA